MKSPLGYEFRGRTIPEATAGGIVRYLNDHIRPGSFLSAVLGNDLREAMGCADDENTASLQAIVAYLYNEAPFGSWGSPENFTAWLEAWEA
jgi:hypothetical protein